MRKFLQMCGMLSLMTALLFSCAEKKSPTQAADERLQAIMEELDPVGLSVAVVKDGKVVYANAFGARVLEPQAELTTHSIFRIASISKTITATGLMQLCEQGKFNLDDDISEHMGFLVRNPKYPDTKITYRMLLSHSSSLNDSEGYYQENALDLLNPQKNPTYANAFNDYEPGTGFEYCNLAFNTLGALLERISGQRFDQYIREHVTGPIGMRSDFQVYDVPTTDFTVLYTKENGEWKEQYPLNWYPTTPARLENYILGYSTPAFSPTGGAKTSPSDLAKFMLVHMNGGEIDGVRLLQKETVELMHTPVSTDPEDGRGYGLDFMNSDKLVPGEMMIGHTGSAYGLYSAMFFNKEKTFGVILMTNGFDNAERQDGFVRIQPVVTRAMHDVFVKGEL